MSVCRSCKAPIIWAITESRKRMPVDREPHPEGNLELDGDQVRVVPALAGVGRSDLHRSHFVTCPDAGQHRQGGGR